MKNYYSPKPLLHCCMRKIKTLLAVLCVFSLVLLAACASSAQSGEKSAAAPAPRFAAPVIIPLFQQYMDLNENQQIGAAFMLRFKNETASALQALAVASPFQREQMLVLIGETISGARQFNPAAYAEYAAALQSVEALNLDEDSRRMLGFIYANIEYFGNKQ